MRLLERGLSGAWDNAQVSRQPGKVEILRHVGPDARSQAGSRGDYDDEVRAIIAATFRVIARTGTVEPTMRDILGEAQLSTPAFYRHFKGKDELLIAIIDHSSGRLMERIAADMDRQSTAPAKIGAWITGIVGQTADRETAVQLRPFALNFERLAERYPAVHHSTMLMMTDPIIQPVMELAGLRRSRAREEANVVLRLVVGVMQMHLSEHTRPTRAELDRLTTFVTSGLAGFATAS